VYLPRLTRNEPERFSGNAGRRAETPEGSDWVDNAWTIQSASVSPIGAWPVAVVHLADVARDGLRVAGGSPSLRMVWAVGTCAAGIDVASRQ